MTFIYRLVSLPPEVITPITDYLNGENITRLYLSGDKDLIHLLTTRGGVQSFRMKFNRFYQCCIPPLVYMIPHLRYLDLNCSYYLRKNSPYPDWNPYKLPASLKSISIGLWEPDPMGEDDLTVEPYSKPLCVLFPRLEFMSGVLIPSTLDIQQLLLFPPLKRLDLNIEYLPFDLIQHLPRSLTELDLALPVDNIETIDWSIDPLFPPDLTYLKMYNVTDSACFQYLPRSLTSLDLMCTSHNHIPSRWNEEHFSLLPTSLKRFESYGLGSSMTLEMIRRLPRELEELSCYGFSVTPDSLLATMNALPDKLTEINDFEVDDISAVALEEVRKIAKLKFGRLKHCRDSLTSFFTQIGWFPEHLLEVQSIRHAFSGTLPDSIQELYFSDQAGGVPDGQAPFALPAHLTLLQSERDLHPVQMDSILEHRFSLHTFRAPLLSYQVLLLPPTLKILSWYQKPDPIALSQDFSLAHLSLLKELHIFALPPLPPKCILFSTLPSSLKDIKIMTTEPHAIQSSELRHLNSQRLPRLQSLLLRGLLALRDEHLATFPASLTALLLATIQNPQLTENCLLNLPAGITNISFPPFQFPVKYDHLICLNKRSRQRLQKK